MPIRVVCEKCAAELRVRDEYAGRHGTCPKCRAALRVPRIDRIEPDAYDLAPRAPIAPPQPELASRGIKADGPRESPTTKSQNSLPATGSARAAARPPLTVGELQRAFQGELPPIRRPWLFHVMVWLLTLVCVSLPLVYLAIDVAAFAGTVTYARECSDWLRYGRFGLLFYTA